jgi:ABC-2 type transport system permease protein
MPPRATRFSLARAWAVFLKELQQMLRDKPTFAMAVGVPVLQLVLFGYAINTDPKGLPTAVVAAESGPLTRSVLAAVQHTGYFKVLHTGPDSAVADDLLARGEVQFVLVVPPGFERDLVRGRQPAILVDVDASDPTAAVNAIAALAPLPAQALAAERVGPLAPSANPAATPGTGTGPSTEGAPFEWRIHRRYNPEGLSRVNIVPGLIGTILTMTMVMLTGLDRKSVV